MRLPPPRPSPASGGGSSRRTRASQASADGRAARISRAQPATLAEALAARAANPDSMPLGGGTDLVVNIRRGIVAPPVLIDMNRVAGAARDQGRRERARDRRLGDAERTGRASRRHRALSGAGAGGRAHRRPDASQHGHGRRQSLPRHALHLLQSERMVARRQQPLPQDHRRHLPRGAEEPRRVLCHLQRRSGAGAADARRRGRHRRPAGQAHHAARTALHRLCAPGRAGHRDARRRQVLSVAAAGRDRRRGARQQHARACARPTTRSASAARSNIRSPASRSRCGAKAARSPTCASPSPAPIRGRCCSRAPTSCAAARSTSACSRASTRWCATRSCR